MLLLPSFRPRQARATHRSCAPQGVARSSLADRYTGIRQRTTRERRGRKPPSWTWWPSSFG